MTKVKVYKIKVTIKSGILHDSFLKQQQQQQLQQKQNKKTIHKGRANIPKHKKIRIFVLYFK